MQIEPIFIIYALCLFLLLFIKESWQKALLIFLSYFLIFILSGCGMDRSVYERLYNIEFYSTNMEPLYIWINVRFHQAGVSFETFRILWLTFFTGMLTFSMYKMTKRFTLSFLILFLGYLQYTLSAYRQFAVIAIGFFAFYLLFYKKITIIPLALSVASCFLHISGILIVGWTVLWSAIRYISILIKRISKKEVDFDKFFEGMRLLIKKYWVILLVVAYLLRIVCSFALTNDIVFGFFLRFLHETYLGVTYISTGLLSRLVLFALFLWVYSFAKQEKKNNPILLFYMLCMFGYMILPFDLFAGRLFNTGRILETIIIPFMFTALSDFDESEKKYLLSQKGEVYISSAKTYMLLSLLVYFVIFIVQLKNQGGYYPYTNQHFDAFVAFLQGLFR